MGHFYRRAIWLVMGEVVRVCYDQHLVLYPPAQMLFGQTKRVSTQEVVDNFGYWMMQEGILCVHTANQQVGILEGATQLFEVE